MKKRYVMSLKKIQSYSKRYIIEEIISILDRLPKAKLAQLLYRLDKSKLPRLSRVRNIKQYSSYPVLSARSTPLATKFSKGYQYGARKKKRKFSKKQLAAQRLFAKRARAGTLRKRKR